MILQWVPISSVIAAHSVFSSSTVCDRLYRVPVVLFFVHILHTSYEYCCLMLILNMIFSPLLVVVAPSGLEEKSFRTNWVKVWRYWGLQHVCLSYFNQWEFFNWINIWEFDTVMYLFLFFCFFTNYFQNVLLSDIKNFKPITALFVKAAVQIATTVMSVYCKTIILKCFLNFKN